MYFRCGGWRCDLTTSSRRKARMRMRMQDLRLEMVSWTSHCQCDGHAVLLIY